MILRNPATAGLSKIWLQQDADSPELMKLGDEFGLNSNWQVYFDVC